MEAIISPSQFGENHIKILRIITRMNIGGPAVQVVGLMKTLDSKQFQQELITGKCLENEIDYLEVKLTELRVKRINSLSRRVYLYNDMKTLFLLIREIKQFKPDIVHTHLAKAGVIGRIASILSGHRSIRIHTYHGHLLVGYFGKFKLSLLIFVEKYLGKVTDHLVAVGEKVKVDLIKVGIGSIGKFSVVNPGLEISSLPERGEILKSLNLSKNTVYCAFIGRLTEIKRPDRMLKVASELSDRGVNIHFIVAGGGDLLAESQKIAKEQSLPVTFLGWCENIEDVLAVSSLILLTSDNEGTPIALIQAGMAGIPSVTTDVGSVNEVVLHGETGLVTDFSVESISDALEQLVTDAEMRKKFGEAAKVYTLNRFSLKVMTSTYSDLYRGLISQRQ